MLNLCAKTYKKVKTLKKMNQKKENGDKFCVQTLFKKVINCNCNRATPSFVDWVEKELQIATILNN